jgi:hypothetical protein
LVDIALALNFLPRPISHVHFGKSQVARPVNIISVRILPPAESPPLPDRFLPSLHCQQEMTKTQQPAQSLDGSD